MQKMSDDTEHESVQWNRTIMPQKKIIDHAINRVYLSMKNHALPGDETKKRKKSENFLSETSVMLAARFTPRKVCGFQIQLGTGNPPKMN